MIRGIVLLSLVMSIVGCGRPTRYATLETPTLSPLQLNVLNDHVTTLENKQGEDFLHSADPDIKIKLKFDSLEEDVIGQAEVMGDTCEIIIHKELDPSQYTDQFVHYFADREFTVTLAHEIGHCFGLDHDPKPQEVMSEYYTFEAAEDAAFDRFHKVLHDKRYEK